jgi:SAM-dependent methyltransferase
MNKQTSQTPWYESWFDRNYLQLYKHRNSHEARTQIELIIRSLDLKKDQRILDLACGDGRYTYLLNELGYRTVGLDLSPELIREGQKKCGFQNMMVGDMRSIPGIYDVILSLFTSFGYFDEEAENYRVFEAVNAALINGGWFWLDFLNPGYIEENLIPETVTEISSFCQVIERRKIQNHRIIKDIIFFDGQEEKSYRESVRLYDRKELESMFLKSGFEIKGCLGDYQGSPWRENTERTIIYGKKNS